MKKEKLSFFKKLYLVITDFRTYPFLVKYEKTYKSILYLFTLVFLISIVFSTNLIFKFNNSIQTVINNYDDVVPEFKIENGLLDIQSKISEKIDKESYIVINTDYNYDDYIKTEEYGKLVIYDNIIIVNKDIMMIESLDSSLKIQYNNLVGDIDKNILYEELTREYSVVEYMIAYGAIYVSIFIGYFIAVLFKILFLSLVISLICLVGGIRLNYHNYIKIAIYSYTLPLIIEIIATCLVGAGKSYTYYASLFLSYVYIIYAVRAVKLDAFIIMFSKNNNLNNTHAEFEKELKKYEEIMNNQENKDEKNENNKE